MKSLDFTYASAQNFLCFGPEGIEIEFNKFGNVVLIRGNNLDVKEEEERIASNGVGKSSIPEIIVYTLFGKTIKQPKKLSHKDIINNQVGKALRTEVRWADYRVVRTRTPDSLRIWKSAEGIWDDDHEISLGGMPATQIKIVEELGLSYESLVNILVFTDNNLGCFLECDTPTKREIVENLLSLSKYAEYGERAKKLRNDQKTLIKDLIKDYDHAQALLTAAQNQRPLLVLQDSKWNAQKAQELEALHLESKAIKTQLESTDEGAALAKYQEAQAKIKQNNALSAELQVKRDKLNEMLKTAQTKRDDAKTAEIKAVRDIGDSENSIRTLNKEMVEWGSRIEELEEKKDSKCAFCYGVVSEENYKAYTRKLSNQIEHNRGEISRIERILEGQHEKQKSLAENVKKLDSAIQEARQRANNANTQIQSYANENAQLEKIGRPQDKALNNAVLEEKFNSIQQQILTKQEEIRGLSPYVEMLKEADLEVEKREKVVAEWAIKLKEAERILPYYEFWVIAFGDKGIRKFVIDGIIPALNSRVAHWLQYLIDGKINLKFDNELNETIERNPSDGDPFVYHAMSGGERRRLNLAVSQAFAHVMMLNSGRCPSVVFLDEVTTNIDPIGVVGVYNMITELAKDRQVFVTTHDQGLLEMLEGAESLNLEKKKGFTKVVSG